MKFFLYNGFTGFSLSLALFPHQYMHELCRRSLFTFRLASIRVHGGRIKGIGHYKAEDIHRGNPPSPQESLHLAGHSLFDVGCYFPGEHQKEAGKS